jgi:hypothetical protein
MRPPAHRQLAIDLDVELEAVGALPEPKRLVG